MMVRIASLVAVVAVSACRPAPPPPMEPEVPPPLRLVGCVPAAPLPRTATDLGSPVALGGEGEFGAIGYATLARQRSHPGAPRVIAGSPTVTGPLDKVVVERMVRSHLPQLRACYERELATTPAMTGTVTVTFLAGPDGRVATTSVLGSGVLPAVSACAALAPAVSACAFVDARAWAMLHLADGVCVPPFPVPLQGLAVTANVT